jgi:hypothetical protein
MSCELQNSPDGGVCFFWISDYYFFTTTS